MNNKTKIYSLTLFFAMIFAVVALPVMAQEISGGFSAGSVKVGYDNRSCSAGLEGAIRYNSSSAGGGSSTEFTTPGTDTYTVPAGVTSVQIEAYGAGGAGSGGGAGAGGGGGSVVERTDTTLLVGGGGGGGGGGHWLGSGGAGGGGGYGLATVSVTPSETLNIWVGGGGIKNSGGNGGDGGTQAGGSGSNDSAGNAGSSTYGGGGGSGDTAGRGGDSTYGGGGGSGDTAGRGGNSVYGGGGGSGLDAIGGGGSSTNGNNGGSSSARYGGGGGYFGDSGSIGSNGSGSTGGAAANSGPGNGGDRNVNGSNGKVVITPVGGGGSAALEFCDGSNWTEFWGSGSVGAGSPMPSSMNPCYGNGSGTCLFMTASFWNGNLGGLSGADSKCASAATSGGLTGTYKAVISSSTTNAKDRFTVTYPVVSPNGVIIEDSNLWAGALEVPVIYREDSTVYSGVTVWTGSDSAGVKTADHCSNWTSSSGAVDGTIGDNSQTSGKWLEDSPGFSPGTCDFLERLYCMLGTGL